MKDHTNKEQKMTATAAIHAEKTALLNSMTTRQLVEAFEASDIEFNKSDCDFQATADAREWLMDELESRDAAAFAVWMDTPDMSIDHLYAAYGLERAA